MPRNSRSTILGKRYQREQEDRVESLVRLRRSLRRDWQSQRGLGVGVPAQMVRSLAPVASARPVEARR